MEFRAHNQTVLYNCEEGDLLEFERGMYSHWGVFIGDGNVVHLTGQNDGIKDDIGNPTHLFSVWGKQFSKAEVKCDDFWDIVSHCKAKINNKDSNGRTALSKSKIVENALSKLGKIGYNVLWYNCEHFAHWCRYGEEKSDQ
uniref:HRAS-like suppressor 3-like n=1 Tax=Saccoglossus kowalevskii TaxID=10224 RepID=A0ABM0LV61_SACKO